MGKGRGFGMILTILMGECDDVSYATVADVNSLPVRFPLLTTKRTKSSVQALHPIAHRAANN
jgi:hypothetical protein